MHGRLNPSLFFRLVLATPHIHSTAQINMTERRPSGLERSPTAPSILSNGHFASVGAEGDAASYEHGVQVIDGDKEFKYAHPPQCLSLRLATIFIIAPHQC